VTEHLAPKAAPPVTEWPPVLVQWIKAAVWNRLLAFHDGPAGILVWLLAGNKHPATGERLPYAATPDYLYWIALEAAEAWAARRRESAA
jgi:hypothetical protein